VRRHEILGRISIIGAKPQRKNFATGQIHLAAGQKGTMSFAARQCRSARFSVHPVSDEISDCQQGCDENAVVVSNVANRARSFLRFGRTKPIDQTADGKTSLPRGGSFLGFWLEDRPSFLMGTLSRIIY
jgi:hypothetical protein